MKQHLWHAKFRSTLPSWPCPTCADGILPINDGLQTVLETGASEKARQQEEWEPDWVRERFSTLFKCSTCAEIVVVTGEVTNDMDYDYDDDGTSGITITRVFEPATFYPSPSVIHLPEKTPLKVASEIDRASALIWLDIGSCANRLRSATEELLTALKIPRTTKSAKGKLVRLTLDARIAKLNATRPDIAELLNSIRFVGNVGTHDSLEAIDREDVLSAFEFMEHALEKLYENKDKQLKQKAKAIAKRKGKTAKKKGKKGKPIF